MATGNTLDEIFTPDASLELCLQLLSTIDVCTCGADLRRFIFEFQKKSNSEVARAFENCGVKCQDNGWLSVLGNANDIRGLLACLSLQSTIPEVSITKHQFRTAIIKIWSTLDFGGVNEDFRHYELQSDQQKQSVILENIMDATFYAKRCGVSDDTISDIVSHMTSATKGAHEMLDHN